MVRTTSEIISSLSESYKQPRMKLLQMVQHGELFRVIRGLMETDKNTPGEVLAGAIYGPSYLSFEYALSRYGLIPERVHLYTSASFGKNKTKHYKTPFGEFSYTDIPQDVFPHGVSIENIENRPYAIAIPEKTLCDKLYKERPIMNMHEILLCDYGRMGVNYFKKNSFGISLQSQTFSFPMKN